MLTSTRLRRSLTSSFASSVAHGEPIPPISQWPRRVEAGSVTGAVAGDTLTGLGVSPGVTKGRARTAFDLSEISELEPGEIIVCSTTDPSWVPLFMIAGGFVCDIGAPASHAAIVSRELGVPCVVSVPDARRRIPNGSLIEIDGLSGTIALIERGTANQHNGSAEQARGRRQET